jgi:hypothetical protein
VRRKEEALVLSSLCDEKLRKSSGKIKKARDIRHIRRVERLSE